MKLDTNFIELIKKCTFDIKSFSKEDDILKYLPIEQDDVKIFYEDRRLFFVCKNKVSYIYAEGNYFSNIEIMRRIGYILDVKLENDDIFSITKFTLNIKKLLEEGEVE